jgi:acetyltransferase-like isoleucine patch superfamily enzyme
VIVIKTFHKNWAKFWMRFSGLGLSGRVASYLAVLFWAPYKSRGPLARMTANGYISHSATIHHDDLQLGQNIFIGDGVIIYQAREGGSVRIGKKSKIHLGTIIETGDGGRLTIGADTHIQPRCQFSAYLGSIFIGSGVQIAPYCAFYPYDHSFYEDKKIKEQSLQTKGDIIVEDDALLGVGVMVTDNVRIGKGAVIGAGSVVTRDIPDGYIAAGNPAQVMCERKNIKNPNG